MITDNLLSSLPQELQDNRWAKIALKGATPAEITYAHAAGLDLYLYSTLIQEQVPHSQILHLHRQLQGLTPAIHLAAAARGIEVATTLKELDSLPASLDAATYANARHQASRADILTMLDAGIDMQDFLKISQDVILEDVLAVHTAGVAVLYYTYFLNCNISSKRIIKDFFAQRKPLLSLRTPLPNHQEFSEALLHHPTDHTADDYLCLRHRGLTQPGYMRTYRYVPRADISAYLQLRHQGKSHLKALLCLDLPDRLGLPSLLTLPLDIRRYD